MVKLLQNFTEMTRNHSLEISCMIAELSEEARMQSMFCQRFVFIDTTLIFCFNYLINCLIFVYKHGTNN